MPQPIPRNSVEAKQKELANHAGIRFFHPENPKNPFLRPKLHLLQNKILPLFAKQFPNDFRDGDSLRSELQTLRRQSP